MYIGTRVNLNSKLNTFSFACGFQVYRDINRYGIIGMIRINFKYKNSHDTMALFANENYPGGNYLCSL